MPIDQSLLQEPVSDYSQIRSKIANGDLLLAPGNYAFSKLIQQDTGSCWSHVAMVMRLDDIDRVVIVESVEDAGIRAVPLPSYLGDYEGTNNPYNGTLVLARHSGVSQLLSQQPEAIKNIAKFAFDLLGHSYAKDDIAAIAARLAAAKIGTTIPGYVEPHDGKYICSEFVDACLKQINIHVTWDGLGFIAPSDVAADVNVNGLWRIH